MKKSLFLIAFAFCAVALNAQTLKTITWGGQERQYLEYVPSTYADDKPAPVLFMLHGMGDQIDNFFSATNFVSVAEEKGWILVCPQALDFTVQTPVGNYDFGTCWAAGVTVTVSIEFYGMPIDYEVVVNGNVDDSGFLMAALDAVEEEYSVDQDSVFFTGFSLGACMSHRMAIEHGERINAIAAVSGVVGNDMQNLVPPSNVNVLEVFGTSDEMISYDNAEISLQSFGTHSIGLPAESTVEYWRNFNHCDEEPVVEVYPDAQDDGLTFEMYSYLNGDNESRVGFLKVNNGMHRWYTGDENDIDYTTEIVRFFTNTLDVTEVAEQSGGAFVVYPNPASDFITINSEEEAIIYNLMGQKVLQGKGNIDISSLPDGLYFVKSGDACQRLVVNR